MSFIRTTTRATLCDSQAISKRKAECKRYTDEMHARVLLMDQSGMSCEDIERALRALHVLTPEEQLLIAVIAIPVSDGNVRAHIYGPTVTCFTNGTLR